MTPQKIVLTDEQQAIVDSAARGRVVVTPRRWGKTTVGMSAILKAAKEEGQQCLWLSPNQRTAARVWQALKNATSDLPTRQVDDTERHMTLPGGGGIHVSVDYIPASMQGAGLDFVVCDEVAFMDETTGLRLKHDLDMKNLGMVLLLSEPYPSENHWFRALFMEGLPGADAWQRWHFRRDATR